MIQPEAAENSQQPDLMLIKNGEDNPNSALFGIEFSLRDKIFESYRGNIHSFNKRVLEHDSNRSFIVSMVTNLRLVRLVVSEKSKSGIEHKNFLVQLDFWTCGLKLIQLVHDEPYLVGYGNRKKRSFEINRYSKLIEIHFNLTKI